MIGFSFVIPPPKIPGEIPEDRYNMTHVVDTQSNQLLDYAQLLADSRLVLINDLVAGFQLAVVDALQAGAVPVILSDDFVGAFSQVSLASL